MQVAIDIEKYKENMHFEINNVFDNLEENIAFYGFEQLFNHCLIEYHKNIMHCNSENITTLGVLIANISGFLIRDIKLNQLWINKFDVLSDLICEYHCTHTAYKAFIEIKKSKKNAACKIILQILEENNALTKKDLITLGLSCNINADELNKAIRLLETSNAISCSIMNYYKLNLIGRSLLKDFNL